MRISPSLELALVAANVVAAVCVAVVWSRDMGLSQLATAGGSPAQRGGPPVLVVVAADSRTDVAVGKTSAEVLGGALLAIPRTGLTEAMAAELSRSRPERVLVLGGRAAVSEGTARELASYAVGTVTRLSGADRYTTAARVATSQFPAPVARVQILPGDGLDLPGPTAGPETTGGPLLLVERTRIPAGTADALRRLRPGSIEVLDGPTAVSDGVLRQLQSYTTGEVRRSPRTA